MPKTFGTFLAAVLAVATFGVRAQNISTYNPQLLYDGAGSFYDAELLREMHVTFEDANYHETLVDAFFNNPSLRIPATVELDGVVLDSVGTRYRAILHFCHAQRRRKRQSPVQPRFQLLDFRARFARLQQGQIGQRLAPIRPTARNTLPACIYRNYLPTPEINLIKLYTQGTTPAYM